MLHSEFRRLYPIYHALDAVGVHYETYKRGISIGFGASDITPAEAKTMEDAGYAIICTSPNWETVSITEEGWDALYEWRDIALTL